MLRRSLNPVWLAAPVLALAAFAPAPAGDEVARYTFSAGPFERTWALLDPDVASTPLDPQRLPPTDPRLRESPAVWERWADAVRAATETEGAAAERLWLAAFARGQGRFDDAWDHLAHAAGDPPGLSAVVPLLAPGVAPQDLERWPVLPDGVLLAPALPPPDRPATEILLGTGRLRRGSTRVEGFRVGEATLALTLTVEGDGVQVDLEHRGGGPARVRVLLPEPPDFELRSEYLDWSRLEGTRLERGVELTPGSETRTLFGRYQPRRLEWPVGVPPTLGAQLKRDGLRLIALDEAPLTGLAAGLHDLLGFGVEVRAVGPHAVPTAFAGVQVDLREAATLDAKRAGLVSVAERFVLSPSR